MRLQPTTTEAWPDSRGIELDDKYDLNVFNADAYYNFKFFGDAAKGKYTPDSIKYNLMSKEEREGRKLGELQSEKEKKERE